MTADLPVPDISGLFPGTWNEFEVETVFALAGILYDFTLKFPFSSTN